MKQLPTTQARACNVAYSGLSNILISDIGVSSPFKEPNPPSDLVVKQYKAIWDTGATNSVVTQAIVTACGLQPTGATEVNTAMGKNVANTYLVALWLPNRICIPSLKVTEGIVGGGMDVLIGMDIIIQGDFAVTNFEGKTNYTFRMPSLRCIDFVKESPPTVVVDGQTVNRPGRSAPCPCGSGKKYKRCHGK